MRIMRAMRRLAVFGAVIASVSLLGAAPLAHADVNNFVVNRFSARETLTKADPQGELHVVERIAVTFSDNNHGILRAIPDTYKHHRLQLHVNSVTSDTAAPSTYTTYTQNGNTVLKIGDPSKTVTGPQEYTIDYTLRNVISFYKDHDELFWDINGDQWAQTTSEVRLQLQLPEDAKPTSRMPICYAGVSGTLERNCTISYNDQTHVVQAHTTGALEPYQTMSIVAGFEKGYFHPSTAMDTLGEYARAFAFGIAAFLLLAVPSFVFWWVRGRDPRGRGVIVPEYDAPDKLSALEVGTLMDFKTDNKDLTATIIGLAVKGYIRIIEETKERMLRKDLTQYTLELRRADTDKLSEFERTLMADIFPVYEVGAQVDLAYLKFKLSKTATTLRKDVNNSLLSRGYFRYNPGFATAGTGMSFIVIFVVASFVLPGLHMSVPVLIGILLGAVVAALCVSFSSSRTAKGVEAKEHVLGLKMYMEVAEADRINLLQSPDARYAEKSGAPKRTVELFEKLLPYAMVLGVENQWAKKFEDLYRTPPDWYSGNWTTFNVLYLTSSLSTGVGGQVNSAFSSPSSSGSSGFGGGGAGGGGGGGGGGGW